jgi:hypothetical protein
MLNAVRSLQHRHYTHNTTPYVASTVGDLDRWLGENQRTNIKSDPTLEETTHNHTLGETTPSHTLDECVRKLHQSNGNVPDTQIVSGGLPLSARSFSGRSTSNSPP